MKALEFAIQNWRDPEALRSLLGQPGQSGTAYFGSIPTDRIVIEAKDGVIVRIKVWSGLNWSATSGWGEPLIDIGADQ